jgi:hypothetical protein
MRQILPIVVLVCLSGLCVGQQPDAPTQTSSPKAPEASPPADASARKARAIIDQAIQALGGDIYLNLRNREQQGRGYALHHGQQTSNGVIFWSFTQFPDKERVELTKERDIAELYVGDKGYEITYKGPHPVEQKDLVDYLRRRHYSLDNVLRTWVKEPGVVVLYEGNAVAAQHEALQVTLINSKDESVTLCFDVNTHLPIKKSFIWRDPVDRQQNLEEEIYENYRFVSGIMAPYNVTRYFNGDMASQRFLNSVSINEDLDQAMFDPNSGYNPNKQQKKR